MVGLGLGHDGTGAHGDTRIEHPCRRAVMVFALTKAPMFIKGGGSAEQLPTVLALNLGAAVSMHTLVAAQVGELRVGFVAHLTDKGFDTAVNVLMLLETR